MGYYQGMNYIAVFLFYTFKEDTTRAYRFFHFVAGQLLATRLGESLPGLIKLLFLLDKSVTKTLPRLSMKFKTSKTSSLHYGVACILPLFTSQLKTGQEEKIGLFWDLLLADGFINIIRTILLLLKVQQDCILQMDSELVVMHVRTIEGHPLNILKLQEEIEEKELECLTLEKITKKEILEVGLQRSFYDTLRDHYEFVHKPILGFWGNKYQFQQ